MNHDRVGCCVDQGLGNCISCPGSCRVGDACYSCPGPGIDGCRGGAVAGNIISIGGVVAPVFARSAGYNRSRVHLDCCVELRSVATIYRWHDQVMDSDGIGC